MASVKFIEHNGKRILYIDLANSDMEILAMVVKETKALISKQPLQSVLTLTDVSGVRVHGMISKVAKEFTEHNKPYVKASAIIGLDEPRSNDFRQVMQYSQRDFKFFPNAQEAIAWLITQ
jgi:hypothetical protein